MKRSGRYASSLPLAAALAIGAGCGIADDDATDVEDPGDLEATCVGGVVGWTTSASSADALTRDEQAALADRFSSQLAREASARAGALAAPADCRGQAGLDHARALSGVGDSAGCLAYARDCIDQWRQQPAAVGAIAYVGAGCAAVERQIQLARELYELATSPDAVGDCPDASGRAFGFAMFAARFGTPDEIGDIVRRVDSWDSAAASAAASVLTSRSPSSALPAVEIFLRDAMHGDDPLLQQVAALGWLSYIDGALARRHEALRLVDQNLDLLAAVQQLFPVLPLVYSDLYAVSEGEFDLAKGLYDAYLPSATIHSFLPNERNVLTYTQMYQDACKQALLAGDAADDLSKLKAKWQAGTITTAQALAAAEAMADDLGDRADLLTFLGAMLEASGDDAGAAAALWRAHELCPYYDRAHWALQELQLRQLLVASPDFDHDVGGSDAADSSLASYVLNFPSLEQREIDGLLFGLRIWLPYLDELVATGHHFYAKRPFELLSETPNLDFLRDTRIQNAGDHRLWDDVRGAGGNPVIADITEIELAPFGVYNLAVHEVSHQVHNAAPAAIGECIAMLFQRAKQRALFINAYAGTDAYEYFAEGVTFFSVPPGASIPNGPTRQWLIDNDPDLERFIAEFEKKKPFDAVVCPVGSLASGPPPSRRAPTASGAWVRHHGTENHPFDPGSVALFRP